MKKSIYCGFAAAITVIMVVALIALKSITFEGGRSVIFIISLLSVLAAWTNIEEQERKNMLLWSFSMYILLLGLLWSVAAPTVWYSKLITVVLYAAIGFYHTYLQTPDEIFGKGSPSEVDKEQYRQPHVKYLLWGVVTLFAVYCSLFC